MRYDHDDNIPFVSTTQVSVEALAVAAKVGAPAVEAPAVSASLQFLDLFKPSILLQFQHRSACCR